MYILSLKLGIDDEISLSPKRRKLTPKKAFTAEKMGYPFTTLKDFENFNQKLILPSEDDELYYTVKQRRQELVSKSFPDELIFFSIFEYSS